MSHTTEIVSVVKQSNGQWAITIDCCGIYRSTHTVAAAVLADPEKKNISVTDARKRVVIEHEEALKAEAASVEVVGTTVTHE